MLEPEDVVQELYRRYGVVTDKNDPVILAAMIHEILFDDYLCRMQAGMNEMVTVLEGIYDRTQQEGQASGAEQFAATAETFFKRLSTSGDQVCTHIESAGRQFNDRIENTATRIVADRETDNLPVIIANTYMFAQGAYWALLSIMLLGGFALFAELNGWY